MLNFLSKKIRYAVRSPQWKTVRENHLKKENKCRGCGTSKKLEVHHKIPVHVNPDLELDPDNLITLCDSYCHFVLGHLMDYKSWNTNIDQDCDSLLAKIRNRPYKSSQ